MSTNYRVRVGTPYTGFGGWTTTEVCFRGFANLTTTRGQFVTSPEFSCFGHQWRLGLYPGGRANSEEGKVSITLCNKSSISIMVIV